LPKQWLKQHTKLLSCFYDLADSNKIITYDEQYFIVINKNENMPTDQNEKIFNQQSIIQNSTKKQHQQQLQVNDEQILNKTTTTTTTSSALHISNKYRVSEKCF
jgi:uncharacterized protein YifE (UPF0438 family)